MGWTTGESGFESQQGRIFFSCSLCSHQPWSSVSFLSGW